VKEASIYTPFVAKTFYEKFSPVGPRRPLPEQLVQFGITAMDVDAVIFRYTRRVKEDCHALTMFVAMLTGTTAVLFASNSHQLMDISVQAPRSTVLRETRLILPHNGMMLSLIRCLQLSCGVSWPAHGLSSARSRRQWTFLVTALSGLYKRQAICQVIFLLL
jgi:hypothetical protein